MSSETSDKQLKDKAIQIHGKDYVLVKDRINFLSENYKNKYSIVNDYQYFENTKTWVVKCILKIEDCMYTGLAQEVDGGSGVNSTSALENAETSAVGRACAMAGIGVIDSIASVDEVHKATNRTVKQVRFGFVGNYDDCQLEWVGDMEINTWVAAYKEGKLTGKQILEESRQYKFSKKSQAVLQELLLENRPK